ncbi:hypothetical protein IC582_008388 [Cucumis melo]
MSRKHIFREKKTLIYELKHLMTLFNGHKFRILTSVIKLIQIFFKIKKVSD